MRGLLALAAVPLAVAAQWALGKHLAIFGIAPQIPLVAAVLMAGEFGAPRAMAAGFAMGLIWDTFTPRLFGGNALLLAWAAYATARLRRQLDVSRLFPLCVMTALLSWVYFPAMALLSLVFKGQAGWPGWLGFLGDPLYNAAMAAVLFLALGVPGRPGRPAWTGGKGP